MIRRFISVVHRRLIMLHRLNIIKTLVFNFKVLPFRQALKFPVYIYGKTELYDLSGKVVINGVIESGMIKMGYRWIDLWPQSNLPTQISLRGDLIVEGRIIMSGGVSVFVENKDARIIIGEHCLLGGGSMIKCMKHISIGKGTRITRNCTLMDTNMHYVKNIVTGKVSYPHGEIKIGDFCWINADTTVTKGTIIPDYSIVARGGFLSKDYSANGNNAFIVGSPAEIKNNTVQRIFSYSKEVELKHKFLSQHEIIINDGPGLFEEDNYFFDNLF